MASSCQRCSAELPFDGASCPDCGTQAPAVEFILGSADRASLGEELLDHLRAATAGEFEIIREIGRGGMARVYLAHELALDRQVALKVLSPLFTDYPEIVKRFQHEARTAGQLSHPHIVPVFAVYQGNDLSFFTMPFVRGASFREILHETGALEVEEAVEYLRQAASGLAYAHEHGVIHRDVKPENMMLEETTGRLVLTDFGLAKALGTESLTLPGDMIGTPHYMAPEQCDGDREVDGRSDQYALSLVGYEMLAGEYPFEADGFRELLVKQLTENPLPLEDCRNDLPPHVAAAIHRALSKDPNARFPAIEEFAWALAGKAGPDRSSAATRRANGASGVYQAKTLWMRDRLLRFHKRRRLKRWTWPAGLSAAAALLLYLGVAAVSRGGPSSSPGEPGAGAAGQAPVFVEIDPGEQEGIELAGPPLRLQVSVPSDSAGAEPGRLAGSDRPPVRTPVTVASRRKVDSRSVSSSRPEEDPTGSGAPRAQRVERGTASASPPAPRGGAGRPADRATADDAGEERGDSEPASGPGGSSGGESGGAGGAIGAPEDALELYRHALQTEDVDGLGRLYGGAVPEKDLEMVRRIFDSATDIQVETQRRDQRLEGDRAVLEVDYQMRYVLERTRRSREFTLKLRMTLESGPGGWRLVAIEQR